MSACNNSRYNILTVVKVIKLTTPWRGFYLLDYWMLCLWQPNLEANWIKISQQTNRLRHVLSLESENLLHNCHATTKACSAERAYIWKSLVEGVQTHHRCYKQPEMFVPFEAFVRLREILSKLLYDSTDSCLSPTKSEPCHITSDDQAQGATCDMTMLHLTKQHLTTPMS